MKVLLGVCGFVVVNCDDLAIFVFMRMYKNGSSFELRSIVNFILVYGFWSRLCSSLMSSHGYFQNMKQSLKYIFHDRVNSPFMLLLLHEELNQGFHRLELLPLGETRCAGYTKMLRSRSKAVVVFLVNSLES